MAWLYIEEDWMDKELTGHREIDEKSDHKTNKLIIMKHLFVLLCYIYKIVNGEVSEHGARKSYIWRVPIQQALSIIYAEAVH